jgi:Uma2 family endonuclease
MVAQISAPIHGDRAYSPEAYLELEIAAETRHEYINGAIVPMTGAMPNHNRITRNLCTAMTMGLRGQPYEVFIADQRLWIPERRIYTYPDVMVMPDPLVYQEGRRDTLTNPIAIVEVLSESTQNYDQGDKFAAYRTIATFSEYLLIDQYRHRVLHHVKTGAKQWTMQEYEGLAASVPWVTVPFEMALVDLYDKVEVVEAAAGVNDLGTIETP